MKIKSNQIYYYDIDDTDSVSCIFIRASSRAKHLSIKVFPRGLVEIVAPKNINISLINKFIESHKEWIKKTKRHFAEIYVPEPLKLPNYVDLVSLGEQFKVDYIYKENINSVRYQSINNNLILTGQIYDDALCIRALKRWLANVARLKFTNTLSELSDQIGNSFLKLQIRCQRTCWGSYSSSGNLSLNYCLLFLSPAHLRYVMIHELCHISHMNHSKRFWKLVEKYEPNYKKLDNELNHCWNKIPVWMVIH